ncbi:hypothetical protein V5799_021853 [Amblyomma americanum]|uniref:Secreted protein n=1 Tax=Amblyomma americanum TaxID=6943 RepID=A0AAQ4FPJ9_AMBAM
MPCSVLAVSWALLVAAMLPAPCRTRAVVGDREDPDRARAIELIKGRILADLGLASAPTGASSSGGQVALNKVHMEHMMRVYRRSLHRSPEEGGGGRGRERGRGRKGVARGSAKEVTHYYSFKNEAAVANLGIPDVRKQALHCTPHLGERDKARNKQALSHSSSFTSEGDFVTPRGMCTLTTAPRRQRFKLHACVTERAIFSSIATPIV